MTLRIVQISDTHISADFPQRTADLQQCVEHINALDPQPDIVVHTGDVVHDGLAEQYTIARRVLNTLHAPYLVLAGNKDDRRQLIKAFGDDQFLAHDAHWVQYSVERFALRLLIVDTLSTDSNKGRLCPQRLAHLEQMLDAERDKPLALFLHHPPFEAAEIPDPLQYEDWSDVEKLEKLLQSYPSVQGIYCGHVHRNIDSSIAGIKASALTCLAGDLRKGKVSDAERKLPVFKLLEFAQPG